jgi:AcrR family transcriptional regulator
MSDQRTHEPAASARRKPAQKRALQTQELIFEAATQLLEQEGWPGFNTNRLAEISGFSVGTIYQYFNNKRELLAALARRESEKAVQALRRNIEQRGTGAHADDPSVRIRAAVRLALGSFGGRLRARRILVVAAIQAGHYDALDGPVVAMAAMLTDPGITRSDGQILRLSPDEAFVLTQATIGAVRSALLRDPAMLKRPSFEDALVQLVAGFLALRVADAPSSPSGRTRSGVKT